MSHFERLHPALQHHIVNSLGWRELRPFQDEVIPSLLAGEHLIVLAPTAGGKTEAAFFPALSRMLDEGWTGLSLLYICPIKALLNNLDLRLQRYSTLLGRRSALWHGDVGPAARRRVLRNPPDCLLTTPESLEVMLVSKNVDAKGLFAELRIVIVDEIHAFAGDDRGWHLLAVLERISRLAGRELQRVGLSATVGNPDLLVDWLAGSCSGPRAVYRPPPGTAAIADVTLDYVGSLQNAALVISRLHRGEKRLVFVDSRSRAEQLGQALRELSVAAFVTHSSLSQEQRRQAEDAFANREDCVIVATSVLELGIDVGDLDRVIQIDSPTEVASFLQRMGRTGRRAGTVRNCLFLATSDDALIRAAGLIDLWTSGFVEPIVPPPEPYHLLAQQLMALILQEGGIGRTAWFGWVRGVQAFAAMPTEQVEKLVDWMLQQEILWTEAGILGIGRRGEELFGHKHFMDLMSVFLSPPLFKVLHGREELGFVDEMTFLGKQEQPRVLLLGGRAWRVKHVDWSQKQAYVEPTEEKGSSRWKGAGAGLNFAICQAIKKVLATDDIRDCWSRRAGAKVEQIRDEFPWLESAGIVLVTAAEGPPELWTFGGGAVNGSLAPSLSAACQCQVNFDSYALQFEPSVTADQIARAVEHLRKLDSAQLLPDIEDAAIKDLKFSECLPFAVARKILQLRFQDEIGVSQILREFVRVVRVDS